MKRVISSLVFLWVSVFCVLAQDDALVGLSKESVRLQDDRLWGAVWEPRADVGYSQNNGQDEWYLAIHIPCPDTYLDVEEGRKVSLEYTDGTKEIVEVLSSSTSYDNFFANSVLVEVYKRIIYIIPNFDNLLHKRLKMIVIQRSNGKIWKIETESRRAKRLPGEIKTAMKQASDSYKEKVENDNYFNE